MMLIPQLTRAMSVLLLGLSLTVCWNDTVRAEEYPVRSPELTVVHSPGGALDMTTRALAREAGAVLGKEFIIRNNPGGGGMPGVATLAKSAPDGYSLGTCVSNTMLFIPWRSETPYRPLRDVEPVLAFGQASPMLIGPVQGRWETIDDFLRESREKPGELRIGVPGLGTPSHIALAMLGKEDAALSWRFVPYAGPGEAEAALLGGHIDAAASGALPRIRGGQFKPLMVLGSSRLPALPDVPSLMDMGFADPGQGDSMFFLLAPAGTPETILQTLENAFMEAARSEAFGLTVEGFSLSPVIMDRAQSKAWLREAWDKEAAVLQLLDLPSEPATRPE